MWISGRKYINWRQENNDRIDLAADQRSYLDRANSPA
jgi:hypothetical protein